jgi:hypothetical protein
LLDSHASLAAVTARVLVGAEHIEDPTCARMAASPLPNDLGVPGSIIFGCMAGACVMRRSAFLAAGGYHPRFFIGAEEALLAIDLMTAGWKMAYIPTLVVHHEPSTVRDRGARRRMLTRNALWCAWLRRPFKSAAKQTGRLLQIAVQDPASMRGAMDALWGLPWVLRQRHVVPPHIEQALEQVS